MTLFKRAPLFLFAFLVVWGMGFAMFSLQVIYSSKDEARQKMDAIIVLTGGPDRVHAGLELFASGNAKNLFISGVHPSVKKHEIEAQWTEAQPLPSCCLVLGRRATTTAENAEESKAWARDNSITSIVLVTSNYHMPRALMEFRHALPETFILSNPIQQSDLKATDSHMLKLLFSEYHKLILRWIQLKIHSIL